MPDVMLYVRLAALVASFIGLAWIVDEIGDRREKKVRAEYAREIASANTRADEAEEHWRQEYERRLNVRLQALVEAQAAIKTLPVSGCVQSESLRQTLNLIGRP